MAVAGAGAMFVSTFLPWIGGSSRREPGYRLANLVLSLHAPLHGAPAWLIAADLYAVPLAGVLAWLVLVALGPARLPRAAGAAFGSVGIVAVAIAVPFLPGTGLSALRPGAYLAATGSIVLFLSTWA